VFLGVNLFKFRKRLEHFYLLQATDKGLPTNKLSNIAGWASCPLLTRGGRDAHPTKSSLVLALAKEQLKQENLVNYSI